VITAIAIARIDRGNLPSESDPKEFENVEAMTVIDFAPRFYHQLQYEANYRIQGPVARASRRLSQASESEYRLIYLGGDYGPVHLNHINPESLLASGPYF
jgi:hypothetical protein